MSWDALLEAWGRWDGFTLAAPQRAAWAYAVGALALLAALRWLWGQRLRLGLPPGEGGAGLLRLLAPLPRLLRLAGLLLLLLALLRPQSFRDSATASVQALDIVLALDVSGSMEATDLKPNRLEAAKATLKQFVEALPGDRMGLVVFAGKAFTQCPLTLDHAVVKHFIEQMSTRTVQVNGTAVGDGLLMALSRLLSEAGPQQRIVVLATDGRSNMGNDLQSAAQLAAQAGVKVYTIGIGAKGGAIQTIQTMWGPRQVRHEEPDDAALTAAAQATGGRYYRATDEAGLRSVYAQIAAAERREVKVQQRRDADEHFYPFLLWGALLLLAEALLRLRVRVTA